MELVHPERRGEFLWLKDVYAHIAAIAKRQPKKKSINLRRYSSADLYRLGGQQAPEALKRKKVDRSEEHTSELQSLMRNSYAVFRLKNKTLHTTPCIHK